MVFTKLLEQKRELNRENEGVVHAVWSASGTRGVTDWNSQFRLKTVSATISVDELLDAQCAKPSCLSKRTGNIVIGSRTRARGTHHRRLGLNRLYIAEQARCRRLVAVDPDKNHTRLHM